MITAIIVDDELKSAKTIEILLQKYCPQVNLLGICRSVAEAKSFIEEHQPQLLLLDIEMPNENGFHLIEQTRSYSYEVIFITAYNQYAISAIKANALDYLLKPLDIEELVEVIKKAEQKITKKNELQSKGLQNLLNQFIQAKSKKLALPSQDGILMVEPNEIVSLRADSNYTYVNLISRKKIAVSKTLKTFEKIMEEHTFIRVHNSYIINYNFIDKYTKGDGGTLTMKDGIEIPVSRSYKQALMQQIGVDTL